MADDILMRSVKAIVEFPAPPAWIARDEWRTAGWEAGWLRFWQLCSSEGGDVAEAKQLWELRRDAATEAITWSQTPAAEGDSFFGTKSCWQNSARRAVRAMTLA